MDCHLTKLRQYTDTFLIFKPRTDMYSTMISTFVEVFNFATDILRYSLKLTIHPSPSSIINLTNKSLPETAFVPHGNLHTCCHITYLNMANIKSVSKIMEITALLVLYAWLLPLNWALKIFKLHPLGSVF